MFNRNSNICNVFAAIALAAFPFAVFAGTDVPLTGITAERFPDADAVMVDGFEDCTYFADGTYVTTNEQWTAVLTEKGRRGESELEMGYSRRYGKAEILAVSIISPDGTERAVDFAATTSESTDNSSASENIYDPSHRKIVCTIPGVKIGDIVYVKTCHSIFKPRIEGNFSDLSVLEWTAPMIRQRVRIRGPKERPLKRQAIRHPLGNVTGKVTEEGDTIVYEWVAENSAQAFEEPDTPPLYTQLQHLRVSTAADWPEISRWYWDLSQPHFAKTNPAITNQVKSILAKCPVGLDDSVRLARIGAIYKWVAQEVRYMGLTMEDTSPGYAPHDVSITFDNRYGVCRDKAALLVVMLRIAGYDAFPVLIHGGAKMDPDVPMPYFNHAIAAVRAPGSAAANADGFILMDPTDESSRDLLPAYLSDKSYLVATPEGETLHTSQVVDPDVNGVKIASEGSLEKDGSILMTTSIDFSGINDNVYRGTFLRKKPAERREMFERMVRNAAPGAELLSFELAPADLQDTTKPLKAKLLTRVPETILRGETRDEFTPPLFSRIFGMANWLLNDNTSLAKRRFPLVLTSTASADETLAIRLEGNLGKPLVMPDDVDIEGPYEFRRSYKVADGVFTATRRLAINAVELSPEEYSETRENIKKVEAAGRKRPVFAKDSDANANIRYRRIARDYSIEGPRTWSVTNTVEMEVLTYDGKKSAAELNFSWSPTWQTVELLGATVSKDGKTVSVSEKEKNVFDCNWAAAAPRYPASKQLVVNLPSVEVGSVIRYTTVMTFTDAPAAFCATFNYDAFEPTDLLEVNLRGAVTKSITRRNLKVLKSEPLQADGRLWRDCETVSLGDFKSLAARLAPATEVPALDWRKALGEDAAKPCGEEGVVAIRDWMTMHVRLAGPSLFELPVDRQLTDPETVVAERYATRLDYARTLAALLKGAGYDADVVFASADAEAVEALKIEDLETHPYEKLFSAPVCRVTLREGGFLGFGGEEKTFFIANENEYTPLGATAFVDSHYLDAKTGEIKTVTVPDENFRNRSETEYTIRIRENGSADIDVKDLLYGPGVGVFRKTYAEMLPEDRSRHYQEVLGAISQAADATGDLITDTESYPAVRSYSCHVPDYATVADGAITVNVPEMGAHVFPLTGAVRETPIATGARERVSTVARLIFPEGYETVEVAPSGLEIAEPATGRLWYEYDTDRQILAEKVPGEGARINVWRFTFDRADSVLDPVWFDHLKSLDRRVTSRANRTVTVRR